MQNGIANFVAKTVVFEFEIINGIDLGHSRNDDPAGIDAQMRVVGDVDFVAFCLDHID